ncbi:DUF1178 family protein [Salibaculum sp.]|uniref:DUF1178 family protein n=1 Tax=Salibaculum sp. TaxID=2855480 RepID=UPI002B46C099|nr:DUF1178 family protein [Salibaculum sp.]HKL69813.1 DUF1178 family protein [Salibaculum sp.]
MIHYTLTCDRDHQFDSWFQSSAAYEKLRDAGQVACVTCGSSKVRRSPMAPSIARGGADPAPTLDGAPTSDAEKAMAALRRQVEENSDYVGPSFARQARAMHDGTVPERAIHGEAKPEEAKALIADGIPVAPLPFIPRRKTN